MRPPIADGEEEKRVALERERGRMQELPPGRGWEDGAEVGLKSWRQKIERGKMSEEKGEQVRGARGRGEKARTAEEADDGRRCLHGVRVRSVERLCKVEQGGDTVEKESLFLGELYESIRARSRASQPDKRNRLKDASGERLIYARTKGEGKRPALVRGGRCRVEGAA